TFSRRTWSGSGDGLRRVRGPPGRALVTRTCGDAIRTYGGGERTIRLISPLHAMPRPRVGLKRDVLERRQPHVLGDAGNITGAVVEVPKVSRDQLSAVQPGRFCG